MKASEIERGAPRLVINYKPLNKALEWIRYSLPNKSDLIKRIQDSTIFSKFEIKSGYYQIGVKEQDRYKTTFVVPFGHYEWNHLEKFINIIKENSLVVLEKKIKIFQTKIRLLGFEIYQGTIKPIRRSIEFSKKNDQNCLGIPDPKADLIVETDASYLGYGGILKQKLPESLKEQVVKYHSILYVQKFQNDIFNKKFLIRTDCKATPSVLTKDVQNLSRYYNKAKPNTLAIIVKNSTTKEHTTTTYVPSPNPLAKTSNKFTPLQYHNVIIGPSKLVNYQNPYEDQYLENDELLPIIVLKKDQAKANPIQVARILFPPNFHYLPIHPHKTRTFYEFILVDIDSIEIFHTQDKQGIIQFSKIKILTILSHQDWNQPMFEQKSFSRSFLPQHSTYYDYMDVWYHFIWFRRGISLKFPRWFIKWFIDFEPVPTIFPLEINETYNYFGEKSSFVPGYHLISFQYETIDIKTLCRQTKVKWWKKFNNNLISKSKIDEWSSQEAKRRKGSIILIREVKIIPKLASATSVEEFEAILLKARSISNSDNADHSDAESSESNPYLRNGDIVKVFSKDWLCDADLNNFIGMEGVCTEKDLLADP
ncbi:hypothetical protein CR513_31087, partial [Mucuna pruriens]